MSKCRKGQSTLEYIIVFTVVVGAVLFAANTFIKGRMQNMFNHATDQAEKAVNHINFE